MDVVERYGVRRQVVRELVKEGFIQPKRGERREYRFSFRDVVLLRMAQELYGAGIPPRKTSRFLRQLRQELPDEAFAAARVTTVGKELVVREADTMRNPSGQLLLDLTSAENVARASLSGPAQKTAQELFLDALQIEESVPSMAIRHYHAAISIDPGYEEAYINLGHLLIAQQRAAEASVVLESGIRHCGVSTLLCFNLAISYEDIGQPGDAIAMYEAALSLDPELADAHFNLARLHEEAGNIAATIRHLHAYKRLGGGR